MLQFFIFYFFFVRIKFEITYFSLKLIGKLVEFDYNVKIVTNLFKFVVLFNKIKNWWWTFI